MPTSLDSLNAGLFSQQLHTQFKLLREGAEPIPLELIEVKLSCSRCISLDRQRRGWRSTFTGWSMTNWGRLTFFLPQSEPTRRELPMSQYSIASARPGHESGRP
jgi:hypothetical protein